MIVALAFVWLNQQLLADSLKYWQYAPTGEMSSLTDRIAFTDRGKFVFYATHPQLDGQSTFNAKCHRHEENAAILGCYAADRIYLYDIRDERLDGIREVTAAHEMLHAAYARLADSDRRAVDKLIEAEFRKLQDDESLAERMAFYARTEPGERYNELHSIIGTEVQDISPALEKHYGNYFSDRKTIIGYYQDYRHEFEALEKQKDDIGKQLDSLSAAIETKKQAYADDSTRMQTDIATFNARAKRGDFSTQAQFERERAALVARVDGISEQREEINALVAQFNELIVRYNATVTESNELYESMDSNLAPAPQV